METKEMVEYRREFERQQDRIRCKKIKNYYIKEQTRLNKTYDLVYKDLEYKVYRFRNRLYILDKKLFNVYEIVIVNGEVICTQTQFKSIVDRIDLSIFSDKIKTEIQKIIIQIKLS